MSKKVKVEMLTSIAGNPDLRYGPDSINFSIGEIVDLHPDQARAWIAGGLARLAVIDPPVTVAAPEAIPESTSIEVPENTSLPEARGRKAAHAKRKADEDSG